MTRRGALPSVIAGVLLTAAVGALFWFSDLDIRLQRLAFQPTEPHWPHAAEQPWVFLHDYGTWPGLALAIGSVLALALSFRYDPALRWRYPALFIFLFMALGPGLVTNLLGKALYGRPRPDEIVIFGGSLPFHRAFEMGHAGKGFSFLCGHCSMGYLFFAFFFLWRGAKRWLALVGSAALGLLLGVGRVVQAAHFPSDILLDGTLMFTVAAAISPIAALEPRRVALPRWKVAAISMVMTLLIVGAFLFSTPVLKEWSFVWIRAGDRRSPATRQEIFIWREPTEISFEAGKGDIEIEAGVQREPLIIESVVNGFGFPGATSENRVGEEQRILFFDNRLRGLFWEAHGHFRLSIADSTSARVSVRTGDGDVVLHASTIKRPLILSGTFALIDPSRTLEQVGKHYTRSGTGDPMILSALSNRVVIR